MHVGTTLEDELTRAEGLILQGQDEAAEEVLVRLAADAEEYVSRNCPTTDELQWFSFPTIFERLAYRRVESDPRELRDVGEPFDRPYADLGMVEVHLGDYEAASRALAQAIRWNPMGCEMRLNLAELYRVAGDMQEYLALSYSVFERASDPAHLARAFVNFAHWFEASEKPLTAAAALRAARRLDVDDSTLGAALDLARGSDHDPDKVNDTQTHDLLEAEGLPDGANAEIAICLLLCASDAEELGQRDLATHLTLRARDLVGQNAAMALLELLHADDSAMQDGEDDGEA
jgi:tetratricopeptide (TPR) repeat protein